LIFETFRGTRPPTRQEKTLFGECRRKPVTAQTMEKAQRTLAALSVVDGVKRAKRFWQWFMKLRFEFHKSSI
jgi:hypothetical protein